MIKSFIFALLTLSTIQILAAGKIANKTTKSVCEEGPESKFYREMTNKFLIFIQQTEISTLPYTVENVQTLMKSTCVETSQKPLVIDNEAKDAINFFPDERRIIIYKPNWDQHRVRFQLGDWTIDNYFAMFRIIHHELIPYFTKKSDPKYLQSLELYTYLKPPVKKSAFQGKWLYVQKDPSPMLGHYMGKNCGLYIDFNRPIKQKNERDDYITQYLDETSLYMSVRMGYQNPESTIECPSVNDVFDTSPVPGSLSTHPWSFSVNCKEKTPKNLRQPIGEFSKYKPVICTAYDDDQPYLDKNLNAYLKLELEHLPNKEIKITYNFHRTTWDKTVFSFSNTYRPEKEIDDKELHLDHKRDMFERTFKGIMPSTYLIQRWVYANKMPTTEQNCALAAKYTKTIVDNACTFWADIYKSWSKEPTTRSLLQDTLFALPKEANRVQCDESVTNTWDIKTANDSGCIVVSEKFIIKKQK